MLYKRICKIMPAEYRFHLSDWYKDIEEKHEGHRRRLMIAAFIIALMIPVILAVIDISKGIFRFLPNYSIPLILLAGLLISFIFSNKTREYTFFVVLPISIAGFILTIYLPNARDVYLIIFFCFPSLAYQLAGLQRGIIWSCILVGLAIVFFSLSGLGILPQLNIHFTLSQFIMGLVAFLISTILNVAGEIKNERFVDDLVKKIVYDEFTNVPNRLALFHSFDKSSVNLFSIIHVENFGDLGIIFGYDLSEEIMLFIVDKLKLCQDRYPCSVFRLKGHELGLLIPLKEKDDASAEKILHDICAVLQKSYMPWENKEIRLNVRMGAVIIDEHNQEDFISRADMALKDGIRLHKSVTLYKNHEYVKKTALHSISLFSILTKNIENELLKPYFQPIVDSKTEEIVWYESLLRVRNDNGCYDSPSIYLPIAESTGLDISITDFMIREACKVLKQTNKNISINITFNDILRKEFLDIVIFNLNRAQPTEGRLILEILERDELHEIEACQKFLKKVREAGCLIAIDDFGSGYSNLSSLLKLPIDIVKIDGTLVKQAENNAIAKNIIKGIVHFCKHSGIRVTAEYVDSRILAEELKKINVDFLQGYYFGIPEAFSL